MRDNYLTVYRESEMGSFVLLLAGLLAIWGGEVKDKDLYSVRDLRELKSC